MPAARTPIERAAIHDNPLSSRARVFLPQTVVRELHSGGDRSCLHIELDISGMSAQYETGDHVAILPENSPAVVEEAARLLGLPLDTVFTLKEAPALPAPSPCPVDLRRALSLYADLLSPPRKSALAALAAAAGDKAQAERLRHLASPSGKADFAAFVAEPQRSLLEILREFPSARPSLGVFFAAVAPRLAPRFYSISSSPKAHARSVHVTAAVVRGPTPTGRVHEGVCTTWLGRVQSGARAPRRLHPQHSLPPVLPRQPSFALPVPAAPASFGSQSTRPTHTDRSHPLARRPQGGASGAGVPAHVAVPPAGGPVQAGDHGGAGDWPGAVPGLPPGAGCARLCGLRAGPRRAVLRVPQREARLYLPR